MMSSQSPIERFIEKQGVLILDGGLATELEARGHDLDNDLWSAYLLRTDPGAIRGVHLSYLESGADCIISSSYQASIPGFNSIGLSDQKAITLMKKTTDLANEARDQYIDGLDDSATDRLQPLVAGSIGPYGAYLANGAEYRGDYGVSNRKLREYHEPRWELLTQSKVDVLACETIPNYEEAEVLLELLKETPDIFAWFSFSCKDGEHISDGTLITECASLLKNSPQVTAIGVNCTAPQYIPSLIKRIREDAPDKRVVVYPNSGEGYDVENKSWIGTSDPLNCSTAAVDWFNAGATLIGGCCRMGPEHIHAMGNALKTERK